MKNQVLLAVPFFILMGTVLERSRLAEDLLETIGKLFGSVRGGLALAVVFVGALLAAATGVVGASVVAMGTISLPVMLRHHYSPRLATGVIAASGTLGQIIPPSVVLIVLADQISVGAREPATVGDLFIGALIPGLALATLFGLYVLVICYLKPSLAPPLPRAERSLVQLIGPLAKVMLPPLILILVVLGSIFWGYATPTEAGALGAVGALFLALVRGRLHFRLVKESLRSTTLLTSMVMFLLVGSTAFTYVFREFGGDLWIEDQFANLGGGLVTALLICNLLIFVLGFFIDFFEIAFIVVPLVAPVFVNHYGVHPAWFGVLVAMNLQTSFLTPPFGFALFYLKGVCPPEIKTTDLYRGVIPFIAIQLGALVLLALFPEMVTGLIDWLG